MKFRRVSVYVPESSSALQRFAAWLTGRRPELIDPAILATGGGRERKATFWKRFTPRRDFAWSKDWRTVDTPIYGCDSLQQQPIETNWTISRTGELIDTIRTKFNDINLPTGPGRSLVSLPFLAEIRQARSRWSMLRRPEVDLVCHFLHVFGKQRRNFSIRRFRRKLRNILNYLYVPSSSNICVLRFS